MQRLVLALIFLGALSFQIANAQSSQAKALEAKITEELKKIDARLKLTPEQKTSLKGIMTEEDAKLDALYTEYDTKETALLNEYRGKMRAVLTPEQQTEWDKIKAEYQARYKAWKEKQKATGATK